ncbi:hypothetical protein JB92DRAFT_3099981 [Gautieria morchelliformis]|nr:hypothetical protein JB92DRAFT_3099981 [Gautieria morchelliformis]
MSLPFAASPEQNAAQSGPTPLSHNAASGRGRGQIRDRKKRALPGAENRKKGLDSKIGAGGRFSGWVDRQASGLLLPKLMRALWRGVPAKCPPQCINISDHRSITSIMIAIKTAMLGGVHALNGGTHPTRLCVPPRYPGCTCPQGEPSHEAGSEFVDRDSTQLDATTSL